MWVPIPDTLPHVCSWNGRIMFLLELGAKLKAKYKTRVNVRSSKHTQFKTRVLNPYLKTRPYLRPKWPNPNPNPLYDPTAVNPCPLGPHTYIAHIREYSPQPERIGPTKSTPTTWKGLEPCVLLLGRFPGGGAWHALARDLLHPWQLPLNFLTRHRSRGTQFFSGTFAMEGPTPPYIE